MPLENYSNKWYCDGQVVVVLSISTGLLHKGVVAMSVPAKCEFCNSTRPKPDKEAGARHWNSLQLREAFGNKNRHYFNEDCRRRKCPDEAINVSHPSQLNDGQKEKLFMYYHRKLGPEAFAKKMAHLREIIGLGYCCACEIRERCLAEDE